MRPAAQSEGCWGRTAWPNRYPGIAREHAAEVHLCGGELPACNRDTSHRTGSCRRNRGRCADEDIGGQREHGRAKVPMGIDVSPARGLFRSGICLFQIC